MIKNQPSIVYKFIKNARGLNNYKTKCNKTVFVAPLKIIKIPKTTSRLVSIVLRENRKSGIDLCFTIIYLDIV